MSRMHSVNGKQGCFENNKRWTYLSDFQSIVDLVLEGAHCDLSDQLWLDDRLGHDEWKKGVKIGNDQVWFIVCRGIQCCQCQTSVLKFGVFEHKSKDINQCCLQNCIEVLVTIGEGVANGLNSHGSNRRVRVAEIRLSKDQQKSHSGSIVYVPSTEECTSSAQ